MRPALDDGQRLWSPQQLEAEVQAAAEGLRHDGTRVMATLLDNTADFVVLDEAAARAGVVHVPLPAFFTAEQLRHALRASGADTLYTVEAAARRWPGLPIRPVELAGAPRVQLRLLYAAVAMPPGTSKITFTSGTTGEPKGVCLSRDALQRVARGLVQALAPLGLERHLNALPFAVLLENIAGLMAPRAYGATCVMRPLAELGLGGSSSFDAARFQAAVLQLQPTSLILLPQMLRAWTGHLLRTGQRAPAVLRLVAVGGAAVGAPLIEAARSAGIPAFEGYGLSEGGSVQTLNLPGAERPGSAGRVLPHAGLRIAADGEVEISGSLFSGYLGDAAPVPPWWPTGDLGSLDADGYLHLRGRKKHLLITAFGRNVSPEWVETALRGQPEIAQAVVFGDGAPALSAVLWPAGERAGDAALHAAVARANEHLPDYARVARWTRGGAAFDAASGLATPNGRPRRDAIWQRHAAALLT